MNTKKVFLIRNVAPDKFGGGETYQLELARELEQHGFTPAILTNSRELLRRAKKSGFKTFTPPYIANQNWSGAKNFLLPLYWMRINAQKRWYLSLFKTERPAVINVQSRDDWISASLAAKKTGTRILWTDHIDFRTWALWNIDKRFKNLIGKTIVKIARTVDKIIFISNYEYNWFTTITTDKKLNNLTVINNGAIDQLKDYSSIKPANNSFCYVGRVESYKGISELIEAFNKTAAKKTGVKLNIYGDGDELNKFKAIVKQNPSITFHGYTEEPLRAIAENEVFVLPSHYEGLSLSLLDAAMMQKTIIATDVGATGEVVKNKKTGILIQPHSAEALSKAMAEVIQNKSLAKTMAKNARVHFEKNYSFERIFEEKMLPLYNIDK